MVAELILKFEDVVYLRASVEFHVRWPLVQIGACIGPQSILVVSLDVNLLDRVSSCSGVNHKRISRAFAFPWIGQGADGASYIGPN